MIRVAAVGDVHLGADLRGRLRPRFAGIADHADVLLLAGDLTQHGTVLEAEAVAGEFSGLGVPVVAVLGNHDYHSGREHDIAMALRDAGISVLEGSGVVLRLPGGRLGVAGTKGFGGGFPGKCGTEFGEPEMKAFVGHSRELAEGLESALKGLDAEQRIALTHYAPVKDTVAGEAPEIYPFLGSYFLAESADRAGADLMVHGHAHHGSEKGVTPGGALVRNVALPVLRHVYAVYRLGNSTEPGCGAMPPGTRENLAERTTAGAGQPTCTVPGVLTDGPRRTLLWSGSGLVAAGCTGWAMFREVATFGRAEPIQTGLDFANNTWQAIRGLASGADIYAPHAVIPGIGPAWPASPHLPGSLLWQAPFAVLPLPAALFAFTFASILAIWAAVFLLTRPKDPPAVFVTACCGGFAICAGGGPVTLLLGQPTGFMLLGLAVLLRSRRPWAAGLGLMLAATTFQTGLPLGMALLVLRRWPVVWRGAVLAVACSLPPLSVEIANAGVRGFADAFASSVGDNAVIVSNRIDLGGFAHRVAGAGQVVQTGAGIAVAGLALAMLARLPPHLRRIDYAPVLSLVIAFTLLCTYHQPYDMLLVGGAVVPLLLVADRSRAMLPVLGIAGASVSLSDYQAGLIVDPAAIGAMALLSALALLRAARGEGAVTSLPGRDGSSAVAGQISLRHHETAGIAVDDPPASQACQRPSQPGVAGP